LISHTELTLDKNVEGCVPADTLTLKSVEDRG